MPLLEPTIMNAQELLQEISEYCRRTGLAESTFGRRAVNDGKLAHMAPPSTIALSGNGLDTAALIEDDEDLTSGAGNGANPNPPQSV